MRAALRLVLPRSPLEEAVAWIWAGMINPAQKVVQAYVRSMPFRELGESELAAPRANRAGEAHDHVGVV